MKQSLALLVVMLLAGMGLGTVPAHGQGGVGVKGGLSYNNVSNRGLLPGNLDRRTGFTVGVAAGTKGGLLGIGAEGLYAQRRLGGPNNGDALKLETLDVPAYLRVMLPTPGIAPYAYAGPQLSYEFSCSLDNGPCSANRPKTTYAATIGGGARLGGQQTGVSIEGRYVYGLTDLKLSTVTSSTSYKTRSFMILGGVSF